MSDAETKSDPSPEATANREGESPVVESDAPLPAIVEAASDHDAVVMGESEPTLSTFVFGKLSERVADRSVGPVLVVKGAGTETDEPGEDQAGS